MAVRNKNRTSDGKRVTQWDGYSHNEGGFLRTRALAWAMAVGKGKWVVRYKDRASRPMTLAKAKTYGIEMVRGIRPGIAVKDHIARLHSLQVDDPMPTLADVWRIETWNYPPLTRPPEPGEGGSNLYESELGTAPGVEIP